MKKFSLLLLFLIVSMTASAQFEKGKKYLGASVSGLGFSYSSSQEFRFGLDANVGYFAAKNFMIRFNASYEHTKEIDDVSLGAGIRYYFDQVGVYIGGGGEYVHYTPSSNDVVIPIEIGYAFFLNDRVTIEPAIYYKMSLHDFSNNSTVGARLGFGFYF